MIADVLISERKKVIFKILLDVSISLPTLVLGLEYAKSEFVETLGAD